MTNANYNTGLSGEVDPDSVTKIIAKTMEIRNSVYFRKDGF